MFGDKFNMYLRELDPNSDPSENKLLYVLWYFCLLLT